ncbi:MAG: PIN domain-containing protein [Gemmatimonadetes bacterium]|nr:PIN domain-containing protein [Gemmatimonadota bacterium]
MIAVDTNVLVYAHRREASVHTDAVRVLRKLAESARPWAIPWPCCYEYFSVVTNRRIWRGAQSTPDQAWSQLRAWTDSPSIRLLGETRDFMDILEGLVVRPRIRGPLVHDARVAAICLAHGVDELLTRDRDFSLFPELKTRSPFVG